MVVKKYKVDWISEGSSEPEEEKNPEGFFDPNDSSEPEEEKNPEGFFDPNDSSEPEEEKNPEGFFDCRLRKAIIHKKKQFPKKMMKPPFRNQVEER
jgi:hypothetical protein